MVAEINRPTPEGGKIAGLFHNFTVVEQALEAAEQLGYERQSVHLVTQEDERLLAADETPAEPERGRRPGEGPWRGALVGGFCGAFFGGLLGLWLAGLEVVAVNPAIAALLAGSVCFFVGLYFGSLFGVGLPEGTEKEAQDKVDRGAYLLSLSPRSRDDADRLRNEWHRLGGEVMG